MLAKPQNILFMLPIMEAVTRRDPGLVFSGNVMFTFLLYVPTVFRSIRTGILYSCGVPDG